MTMHRRAADGAWWRGLRRDLAAIAKVAVPAFFLAYACAPTFRTAEAGGEPPVPVRLWLKLPDVAGDCYGANFPTTAGQAHLKADGIVPLTASRFSGGQVLPLSGVRMNGGWQLIPDGERAEVERLARRGEVEILVEAVGVCAEKGKRKKLFNVWMWRRVKG